MKSIKKAVRTAAGLLGLIAIFALPVEADQVILDDLIVSGGSLCVGFDCVNGESFGFDTLRLKENNLRIHFQDTSTSASFPSNDWRISANDTSNGGLNWLGFEDSTAGRVPFRVEAGARANALYVEGDGDIGIGTNNPVVDVHIVTGNTPTLRLDQDGSNGFTPQIWDVAGNEANFFIRDATNGSKLVMRFQPGAPDASIYINSGGDIGSGAGTSPDEELHVRRTVNSGNVSIKAESTQARQARMILQNTQREWRFTNSTTGDLSINDGPEDGDVEFTMDGNGNVTIFGQLVTGGPQCPLATPCDLVFSPEYEVESIKDHAASMWQNQYLPAVGPTSSDKPFNLTEKAGRMLNELEKAHIYIEQLHDRLAALEAKISADESNE